MGIFKQETTARDRAAQILAELPRIDAALEQADAELQSARGAEASLVATAGSIEASLALGEDIGDPEAARKAVRDVRERIDAIESRKAALAGRRTLREDELLGLEDGLNVQLQNERNVRLEAWLKEFDKHVAALRACLFRGLAIGQSTGWDVPIYMRSAKLADPRDIGRNVLDLSNVTRYIQVDGTEQPEYVAAWQTDPTAVRFFDELEAAGFPIYRDAAKLIEKLRRKQAEDEAQARTRNRQEVTR